MMKHLRYDLRGADESGESRHAQVVMKDLGIKYFRSTPQSLGDQWWFWCCENIPDPLPPYLTDLNLDPMKCIGYGLSPEEAKSIAERTGEQS
jgi:hypothetical protein